MKPSIHPKAEIEISSAAEFYLQTDPEIAVRFFDEVADAIARINRILWLVS